MNKNLNLKNEIGITLVALIVTIIILLILAGISIATLTGSGLFENAKLAEQESKNAQEVEDSTLKDYENKIEGYLNGNRNDSLNMDQIFHKLAPAYTLESIVDISSYNSATNQYTAPKNGYILLVSDAANVSCTAIYINDVLVLSAGTSANYGWERNSGNFMIEKGSKVYVVSANSGEFIPEIYFVPCNYEVE